MVNSIDVYDFYFYFCGVLYGKELCLVWYYDFMFIYFVGKLLIGYDFCFFLEIVLCCCVSGFVLE